MLICESHDTQSENAIFSMFQFKPNGCYRPIIWNLSVSGLQKKVVQIQRNKRKENNIEDDDIEGENGDNDEIFQEWKTRRYESARHLV